MNTRPQSPRTCSDSSSAAFVLDPPSLKPELKTASRDADRVLCAGGPCLPSAVHSAQVVCAGEHANPGVRLSSCCPPGSTDPNGGGGRSRWEAKCHL